MVTNHSTPSRLQQVVAHARAARAARVAAQVPPPHIRHATPTVQAVRDYPAYYFFGDGYAAASTTRCPHKYLLTSSCPAC